MTEVTTTEAQPTALEARKAEVETYSTNVTNYQAILLTLNGDWDDDLVHLKDIEGQEAARQCPMDRLDRLAELQLHDQLVNLLKTETVERFKAQAILNSMLNA